MVLVKTPGGVPSGTVTLSVIVQVCPGLRFTPEKLTVDPPAGAVTVVPALQAVVSPEGVATIMPAGNVSVSATFVKGSTGVSPAGSVLRSIFSVSVDVPPGFTAAGLNALVMTSGVKMLMRNVMGLGLLP